MIKILFPILFLIFSSSSFAKSYNLEVKKQKVFITGKAVEAITINDSIPGPTLYWQEGEEVIINVKNKMDETTSIHWHGILLDGFMDGVPGLNDFHGIAPHSTFTYKFKIRQSGTYWYHPHSNLQEQQGMYGAIVIKSLRLQTKSASCTTEKIDKNSLRLQTKSASCTTEEIDKNSLRLQTQSASCATETKTNSTEANREYVILLSDFTEENPNTILNNLKIDSGYYNYNKRTIFTFFSDIKKNGFSDSLKNYLSWGKMRMDPTDLSDVTQYHFLINGKTAQQNWSGIFKLGERVKLRFVNASAMTIYDISIPGLQMQFIEADGQKIKPVIADEFRIGVAETYDVIVEPKENKAYTIMAQSLDRTGYARGTLAPKEGMEGEIPKMRPRAILTMADMAMDEMDHDNMVGMNMEGMKHDEITHSSLGESLQSDPTNHMTNEQYKNSGWNDRGTPPGNKALEYSDLVSFYPQKDLRQPTREIEFKFGGAMNRYIWTINGEKFPKPIHLKYGERIRLKFINETMMAHPIHLHGMFMQMEKGEGKSCDTPTLPRNCKAGLCNATASSLNREDDTPILPHNCKSEFCNATASSLNSEGDASTSQPNCKSELCNSPTSEKMKWLPNKHTVIVAPGQTISMLLTADEAGEWAFHCHLLFHMASGMMTSITVDKGDK